MLALIDLDPLLYEYGNCQFLDGGTMPGHIVAGLVDKKINKIVEASGSDDWRGYLTFGPDNFRFEVATIREYKGNRKDKVKPPLYDYIKGYLLSEHFDKVELVYGQEADDAASIKQYELGDESIICTIDKDLDIVPGWHYRWSTANVKEILPWYQSEVDGLRAFYKQCLTGDAVDNIPGLRGVGPKSSHLHKLNFLGAQGCFEYVRERYKEWYGNYGDQFLLEVGRLLWMRSKPEEMWEFPEEGNFSILPMSKKND